MKEINKYPELPTAPPVDEGQGYRLQKINEIQNFLEGEVTKRQALSKKLPAVIAIEGVAAVTSFLSLVGKYVIRNSTAKAEKHEKIKTIADTKLNTISSHVSKALSDNKVTDEELQLIMEELEKYKKMKEEIRSKSKKKIMSETEGTLIERGRREQRESFRRFVEKHQGGPLEY